ncbi:MAG: hypothetical protein VYA55_07980 [Pseudomonadota bacterium]|nr:hypothetical protein [Pseudomonadota bacterium]
MDLSLYSSFLIYAALFRCFVIIAGVICIILGYKLLLKGILPTAATNATAEFGTIKLSVKNAAPGTCFALFGVWIIVSMLIHGNPELVLEGVSSSIKDVTTPTSVRLKGISNAPNNFDAYFQEGLKHEANADYAESRRAFSLALAEPNISFHSAAIALNQVAWGYLQEARLDEALAISRVSILADQSNADFLDTMAQILLAKGLADEANMWAERAVELNPNNLEHQSTLTRAKKSAIEK